MTKDEVEDIASSDSDLEIEKRNLGSGTVMSDLEFIRDNVIDTSKPKLELIPSPKKPEFGELDKLDAESSSEDGDSDGKHELLDMEKEGAELEQMLANRHSKDSDDSDEDENENDDEIGSIDEEDGEDVSSASPPRTKNEIPLEEAVQVFVESEEDLNLLGILGSMDGSKSILQENIIQSLVEVGEVLYSLPESFTVVVQGVADEGNSESSILNEGSILFRKDGVVLGRINEVFGPVTQPFYLIRLDIVPKLKEQTVAKTENMAENKDDKRDTSKRKGKNKQKKSESSSSHVTENATRGYLAKMEAFPHGSRVCCLPNHASTAFVSSAMLQQIKLESGKGCDASNVYDEEVPPEEREFSDDEAEAAARNKHRKKRSGTGPKVSESDNGKPEMQGGQGRSLLSQEKTTKQPTKIHYYQAPHQVPVPVPPPPPQQNMLSHGLALPHQSGVHVHAQHGGVHSVAPGYPQYPQYVYPSAHAAGMAPHQPGWGTGMQPWPGFQPSGPPPAPMAPPHGQSQAHTYTTGTPNLTMSFHPGPSRPAPQYQAKPLAFPRATSQGNE